MIVSSHWYSAYTVAQAPAIDKSIETCHTFICVPAEACGAVICLRPYELTSQPLMTSCIPGRIITGLHDTFASISALLHCLSIMVGVCISIKLDIKVDRGKSWASLLQGTP